MTSLQYEIEVSKDDASVSATWDISVDLVSTEIIQDFTLTVNGTKVDTHCSGGNKACRSTAFATLADPTKDCQVTWVITTTDTVASDQGILRGLESRDTLQFP